MKTLWIALTLVYLVWVAASLVAAQCRPGFVLQRTFVSGAVSTDYRLLTFGWPLRMLTYVEETSVEFSNPSTEDRRQTRDLREGFALVDGVVVFIGFVSCWTFYRWMARPRNRNRFSLRQLLGAATGLCVYLCVAKWEYLGRQEFPHGESLPMWIRCGLWATSITFITLFVSLTSLDPEGTPD